ncbi:glycosyltransferase family 10 [Alphaproteobacteria bacterium]|nr:glycosyltransferase family 10 [Alphaproteobacteria bacterium]
MKNYKKVCMILEETLEEPIYFRQTFGSNGVYGNYQFLYDQTKESDFYVAGNWTKKENILKRENTIFLQQEPPEVKTPDKEVLDNCILAITPFNINHPIKQFIAPPVLQWTYDINASFEKNIGHKYTRVNEKSLNDLLIEEPPVKTKLCSMILSQKTFLKAHRDRLSFAGKVMNHFKNRIDFYGFGIKDIKNKKDALDPYLFSIALENCNHNNYWTEKIADVFLGCSKPIYYGCPNINDFFQDDVLSKININNIDESISKIEKLLNNPDDINPKSLFDARRRVLLEYNMFRVISVGITNYLNS